MQTAAISSFSEPLANLESITFPVLEASSLNKRLSEASDEILRDALYRQLIKENLLGALRASEELSKRGVAPIFQLRHPFGWLQPLAHGGTRMTSGQIFRLETTGCVISSETLSLPSNVEFMLLCIDLQWVAIQYPAHKPEWLRAAGVFKKADFLKTAKYLFWGGRREAGQISKALALSPEQQRGCCLIKCLRETRWQERLLNRCKKAVELIESASSSGKDFRAENERRATIQRRKDIWLCAEMADWKPQRTADFYRMLTGQVMQRNNIANQMAKLPKVPRSD